MIQRINFYYFSSTGGTKKIGETFSWAAGTEVHEINLGKKDAVERIPQCDLNVVAAPVFGGRIPALVSERLARVSGENSPVVSIVVYGTRAYEDALLELNNVLTEAGFHVLASGAFVAQHSMAPEIGPGRPDEKDLEEIKAFAARVLEKMEKGENSDIQVPGNFPYKQEMKVVAAPLSLDHCNRCGKCVTECPTEAIYIENHTVQTVLEKCILCAGCTKVCPEGARILPPPVQQHIQELLSPLKNVHRENEMFL